MTDIISAIDAATGCQQCGNPLRSSPSADFCGEFCQATWQANRIGAATTQPKTVTVEVVADVAAFTVGITERFDTASRLARRLAEIIHRGTAAEGL